MAMVNGYWLPDCINAWEPETTPEVMKRDVEELLFMQMNLISLYEEESKLKKHHKPYLHVREYADEVCEKNRERCREIRYHYRLTKELQKEKCFACPLKKRGICPGMYIPDRSAGFAENAKVFEKNANDRMKAYKEYSLDRELQAEILKALSEGEQDEASEAPEVEVAEDMVVLNTETFEEMQDDLIALTTVMDHLANALNEAANGCDRRDAMKLMAKEALKLSCEIFNRWDNTLLVGID